MLALIWHLWDVVFHENAPMFHVTYKHMYIYLVYLHYSQRMVDCKDEENRVFQYGFHSQLYGDPTHRSCKQSVLIPAFSVTSPTNSHPRHTGPWATNT